MGGRDRRTGLFGLLEADLLREIDLGTPVSFFEAVSGGEDIVEVFLSEPGDGLMRLSPTYEYLRELGGLP
jgi:hypothetical protein